MTPGIDCPTGVAAGLDLGHREGVYVRSGGRKVTWMFNGSAACISLTPQLHASYPHAEILRYGAAGRFVGLSATSELLMFSSSK